RQNVDAPALLAGGRRPGPAGFETAAQCKQWEGTRHIPIIFPAAISADRQHAARGYSAGSVDYITKPFDPWLLQAKVSVFIDLHRKNRQLEAQAVLLHRELQERQKGEEALARQADDLLRANAELEHFGAMASRGLAEPLQHG